MIGERPGRRANEIATLRLGAELGVTVIDTAEMYDDGAAERSVRDYAELTVDGTLLVL